MSWIKTLSYDEAKGRLKRFYDRIKGPNNVLDNVLTIHSLRPHTLEGHMAMYKAVLHHSGNTLPKWYLETLGTYVSQLNACHYCATHHAVGLKRNLQDDAKFALIEKAMPSGNFENILSPREIAGIKHAKDLTLNHAAIKKNDIDELRQAGFTDGEILEINQVVSYFCYVNRMVVGLGVDLEKDNIGLSPSGQGEDDWAHS